MKKFNFRLQSLLRLRKQQEDDKKRVVGNLLTQINEQQQQALQMSQSIKTQGEKLKEQYASGCVDLDWVSHYYRFVSHTRMAINQRILNVTEIQKKLTVARRELAEAAKQTKILDKLKEKQRKRYDRKLKLLENAQTDEIGANTFTWNRKQKQEIMN